MWMEEKIGTRVNRNRSNEVIASGAEVAAVACPFCTIMISDGTGAEVMQRIAAPLVGGLVTSTLLTLLVIPAMFLLWKSSVVSRQS